MDSISLQKIRYFIAVFETGSITKAARSKHISPSVVSEAISVIESETGKKLFVRTRGGLSPTPLGQKTYESFKAVITQLDNILYLRDDFQECVGTLKLTVSATVSDLFLLPLLRDTRHIFPKLRIELEEIQSGTSPHQLDPRPDIILLITSNYDTPDGYEKTQLEKFPRKLWVSEGHRLAKKEKIIFDDISDENYIQCTLDNLEYFIRQHVRPKTIFRTISIEATRSMVGANMGVTIMPDNDYIHYTTYGDRIVRRTIHGVDISMELGILTPKARRSAKCIKLFLNYLKVRNWNR